MTDDESTPSIADKDEFEKFMQESLSSDVPTSVESDKSSGAKPPYQFWWMDSSKSPTARPTATSTWLKKAPKDSLKALGDSQALTSSVKHRDSIEKEGSSEGASEKEATSNTLEQDESDKESHYSDTFESASSTASRDVDQGNSKDSPVPEGRQISGKTEVSVADMKHPVEQTNSPSHKVVRSLQSNSSGGSSPSRRGNNHATNSPARVPTAKDLNCEAVESANQVTDLLGQLENLKELFEAEKLENEKLKDTSRAASEREAVLSQQLDESKTLLELEQLESKRLKDKIRSSNDTEKDLSTKLSELSAKLKFEQEECQRLKSLLETSETELSRKLLDQLEFEQTIATLQKENVLLLAKIEELELKGKQSTNGIINSENINVVKDQVLQLQKEIQDQEALLVGYQKENERLYSELKSVQKAWKVTEGKLKTQNQQLTGDVTRLREQIQVLERAKNFKLNTDDKKKEDVSPQGSNKVTVSEDLIQKYQDEIRQLLDVTKNLEDERNAFEKVHIQDAKTIDELRKKVKDLEDKLKSNVSTLQAQRSVSPSKNFLEHDIDAAKIKTLQNEIAKLQTELKAKDQERKDISKFYEDEYKKLKVGTEKKESELRSSQLEFQPLRIKIEELRLELEAAEDRNKQLSAQLQRKRQITKSSKAVQVSPMPEKKRSDIVLENKELKSKVEKLESEKKEMESNIQVIKNEVEKLVEIEQHEKEIQIEQLKKKHVTDLQKVVSEMAAQQSTSKVAELMNKLQSQEILIGQIRDQTREIEEMKNRIELLQVENSDLETEIKELRTDLSKAKTSQTPQMKDFLALQEEIRELEKRQHRREEELHYLTHQLKRNDYAFLKQEVVHWQNQVLEKNKELEYFRSELNTILVFLGELERQGITIPNLKSREKSSNEAASGRAKPP